MLVLLLTLVLPTLLQEEPRIVYVKCGTVKVNLPLLRGPSQSSGLKDYVECGQDLSVLEEEGGHPGWLKIRAGKGQEGYLQSFLVDDPRFPKSIIENQRSPQIPKALNEDPPKAPPDVKLQSVDTGRSDVTKPSVIAPQLIYRVEPEYTAAARRSGVQGTVVLYGVVDAAGAVRDLRIVRTLDTGLDEKAIEAVRQWKFRPGIKDGRPVPVAASILLTFRLLDRPARESDTDAVPIAASAGASGSSTSVADSSSRQSVIANAATPNANAVMIGSVRSEKAKVFLEGYGSPPDLFRSTYFEVSNLLAASGVALANKPETFRPSSLASLLERTSSEGESLLYLTLDIGPNQTDRLKAQCFGERGKLLWTEEATSRLQTTYKGAAQSLLEAMQKRLKARLGTTCLPLR